MQLNKIKNGLDIRREQAFEQIKNNHLVVAKKEQPLGLGGPLFTKGFSGSLIDLRLNHFG